MEITQKEVINKVSDLESLRKWTRIWDCHEEPHGMPVVGKTTAILDLVMFDYKYLLTSIWRHEGMKLDLVWFVQPNSWNQSLNQLFAIFASSTLFLHTRHIFILSLWKYQPNKKAIQKPVKITNNAFIIIQRLGMSKNGFFLSAFCRASQ